MPPIKGVLFDAMNTLIYPDPPVFEAYEAVARRQGVILADGAVNDRLHHAFHAEEERDRLNDLSTSEAREERRWRHLVAATLPELPDPERGFQELWDHFARSSAWRCYPDVEPLLQELDKRGIPWAIASNFDSRLRDVASGLAEFAKREARFAISSELGWKKPHPAFFEMAASHLGVANDRVLFIGDDLINDAQGATRAGMRAALLKRKTNQASDDFSPTLRALTEAIPLIDEPIR